MIILDTHVLSELMREAPDARVFAWVNRRTSAVGTTAVNAAEILSGVARLPTGERRDALAGAIAGLLDEDLYGEVLPFDAQAATEYANIVARRERSGRPISMADAQIAAVCRATSAVLATRNTGDFDGTGIELVDPWRLVT